MPYLYTRLSIYCHLSRYMTVASVSSHLVIRTQCFWKIKEKKIEKKINIDLAIIASQSSERRFMTLQSLFGLCLGHPFLNLVLVLFTFPTRKEMVCPFYLLYLLNLY